MLYSLGLAISPMRPCCALSPSAPAAGIPSKLQKLMCKGAALKEDDKTLRQVGAALAAYVAPATLLFYRSNPTWENRLGHCCHAAPADPTSRQHHVFSAGSCHHPPCRLPCRRRLLHLHPRQAGRYAIAVSSLLVFLLANAAQPHAFCSCYYRSIHFALRMRIVAIRDFAMLEVLSWRFAHAPRPASRLAASCC